MTVRRAPVVAFLMLFVSFLAPRPMQAAQRTCSTLASVRLDNGSITSASEIRPGAFALPAPLPPPNAAGAAALANAPAFCRVTATLTTSDSDIKIEVWLPLSGWSGKLQAVGNGGWAGTIPYTALAAAVAGGYAGAATDTGHSSFATPGASFVPGHPEKLIDYAHRSLHEMTVAAKSIIGDFYAAPVRLALWNGCSTGGNQGLTIASKYPHDYDGIIAGAPPDPRSRLFLNRLVHRTADSYIPPEKYPAIHAAALNACDRNDGLADGVIQNRPPVDRSARLYMVPGMNHCSGGAGTDVFDKVGAMEEWIARGRAPDAIIASRVVNGKVERTRPLCPYPQVARYRGWGDVNDAGSFACAEK